LRQGASLDGARKRAAIETYVRHEAALRRTAQRYSLCADDADDALQRALEILLRKAPSEDPRELIRWTQTVVKHEAHAVRRERERILGRPAGADSEEADWVDLIPTDADGPPERAVRREAIARSREALQALKPQELRALALLAEGYSYAEIGEITGFSRTKINRCLAEGRERFRSVLSRSQDGRRCIELRPLISAFCDGEAEPAQAADLREHLRACARCRATMRAYRAAPAAAAALAPLPLGRSLLERVHAALADLTARIGDGGADSAAQIAATGGPRGAGMAAIAKALAICVGTAGGAAACAATGVVGVPFAGGEDRVAVPRLAGQRSAAEASSAAGDASVGYEPAPEPEPPPAAPPEGPETPPPPPAEPAAASGSVEYAPPPPPAPEAASATAGSGGDPAGEFGP
jgi:RNA polymerase sigma factor (sigma-70 family)